MLKKYNIKYNEDFRIYKKLGLIHCQVDDWRGPVEVDGFPVLTIKSAALLLIESCAFDHYLLEEKEKREELIEEYPLVYGEYETRKYLFENILKVIKDYDEKYYVNLKEINALFLRRAGVEQIEIAKECTACQPDRFWSHRRVGNQRGSQGAIIVCKGADK